MAPMMPERTQGMVILWATSQSVIPSAVAPSLGSGGTCWNRSRVVEAMIGMIISAEYRAGGQEPFARSDRVTEVAQDRDVGHVVGDDRVDVAGQYRPEREQAPQADDHAGDPGQHLDGEPERPRDPAWAAAR